jgi:hypothetical protein
VTPMRRNCTYWCALVMLAAAGCSTTTKSETTSTSSVSTSSVSTSSVSAVPVAGESTNVTTGTESAGTESAGTESTGIETTVDAMPAETTAPAAFVHLPEAVSVAFDAARNDARPLKETVLPVTDATDVLAMKITGFSYRGVICGFSLTGEAPPSPLTIRQFVRTPSGTFDSGPIDVTWTSLTDDAVSAGTAQNGSWNFNAEAHVNRSGPGWVVSIGGVTPSIAADDIAATPTDGGCELRSANKVFTAKTGPVGYWAGFAVT